MTNFQGWMAVLTDGRVVVEIGDRASEDAIWNIALGWPDKTDIRAAIALGAKAVPCVAVPLKDWQNAEMLREMLVMADAAIERLQAKISSLRNAAG